MKILACSLLIVLLTALTPALEANSDAGTCGSGTLQDYERIGQCILGGTTGGVLVFQGFSFSGTGTPGAIILNDSQIEVSPLPLGLGGGFNFGGFTAGPVRAGQTVTYTLNYNFFIDPGPISSGADMGMDPPFGNVLITQAICADSILAVNTDGRQTCQFPSSPSPLATFPQTFSVDDSNPPASWVRHLTLNPPIFNFAYIRTTFVLDGGTTGAGFDSLSSTYTVVPTPEPLTSAMGIGGLIALGLMRRYLSNG